MSNAGPSLLRALGAKANVPIGVAHQHIAHEAVRLSWPDLSARDPTAPDFHLEIEWPYPIGQRHSIFGV